jgi:outer membrane protein assembly factor BamA
LERFKIKNITYCLFVILFLVNSKFSYSQENDFVKGAFYTLDEIKVTGLKTFNEQTVVTYTGLFEGQNIRIPGEEISQVINKLWKLELFSDINFGSALGITIIAFSSLFFLILVILSKIAWPLFGIKGKGCDGSMAVGVIIG